MVISERLIQATRKAVRRSPRQTMERFRQVLFDPPTDLIIDTSTRCNLQCRMCSLAAFGEWQDMSLETFRHLKDVLARVKHVSFTCSGEPTMNRYLADMIALARSSSRGRLSLITNGCLLNEKLVRDLVDAGLDELTVSLDGATAETHEAIRRGARFSQTLDHIRLWNSERNRQRNGDRPGVLRIGFVAMKSNIVELPALVLLAHELGAEEVKVNGLEPYSEQCATEILYGANAAEYGHHFARAAQVAASVKVSLRLPELQLGNKRRCWPFPHVGWDGTVRPCGALVYRRPFFFLGLQEEHLAVSLGDIHQHGFLTIWRSAPYRGFRRQVRQNHFPRVCHRCLLSYGVIC